MRSQAVEKEFQMEDEPKAIERNTFISYTLNEDVPVEEAFIDVTLVREKSQLVNDSFMENFISE